MEASQIAKLPNPQLKQILLYLYGYQTTAEQLAHITDEDNGVGFNMIDADILSSFAQQVIAGRELSTEKQYPILRLRLPKYHRQLVGGAWEKIQLPEVVHSNGGAKKDYSKVNIIFQGQPVESKGGTPTGGELTGRDFEMSNKVKYAGILAVDPDNHGLMFTPARHTYPSKQIKALGFGMWKNGAWHQFTPKVYQTVVDDVAKMFGEIDIDPSVIEALKPKEATPLPSGLEKDYPSLKPFQLEAIQFTSNTNRLLLALAPRLGKTVVTVISADIIKAQRILVVAPLSLLRDWRNKIMHWSKITESVAIVYKKNLAVQSRWTVTNYDTLRRHPDTFNREKWDLVIVDESLLIKNRKAKRTEAVKELLISTKPKYAWLLSGAPTSKFYTDLWAQFNTLDPKQFTSYWRFAERYCIVEANQWSNYNIVANSPTAATDIQRDLGHIFYTRSHQDVTDLPELEPETLEVGMMPYQDKLYAQMEERFLAELTEEDTLLAPNVLAQMLRLVQIASNPLLVEGRDESAKWDAVVEMLQYELRPTILWTSFIETVKQFPVRIALKEIRIKTLTGATKQEERGKIQEAFQAGDVDLLIAHPAVGKYGLDLFNAKSVIYLERGYNRDDYYQSLMRVRYLEQKEAPHIVHLLSGRKDGGETIDHVIDRILRSGTDATKRLTTIGLKQMMGVLK